MPWKRQGTQHAAVQSGHQPAATQPQALTPQTAGQAATAQQQAPPVQRPAQPVVSHEQQPQQQQQPQPQALTWKQRATDKVRALRLQEGLLWRAYQRLTVLRRQPPNCQRHRTSGHHGPEDHRIKKAPLLCPCTMLHNVVCAACRLLAGATSGTCLAPAAAPLSRWRSRGHLSSSPSLPLGESAHVLDAF